MTAVQVLPDTSNVNPRDKTARRLLGSSARNSYAPDGAGAHGPLRGAPVLWFHQVFAALAAAIIADCILSPKVYDSVGLDRKQARRAAKQNPNFQETKTWMAEKIMPFLDEVGMINPVARWIYRRAHLLR